MREEGSEARALEINPRDSYAWFNKAQRLEALGRIREAIDAYRQFCAVAPPDYADYLDEVRQRIRELEER